MILDWRGNAAIMAMWDRRQKLFLSGLLTQLGIISIVLVSTVNLSGTCKMENEGLLELSKEFSRNDEESDSRLEELIRPKLRFRDHEIRSLKIGWKTLPWIVHSSLLLTSLVIFSRVIVLRETLSGNCAEARREWGIRSYISIEMYSTANDSLK